MKNKLTDLNDYIFQQIERLNDEDLCAACFARQHSRPGQDGMFAI